MTASADGFTLVKYVIKYYYYYNYYYYYYYYYCYYYYYVDAYVNSPLTCSLFAPCPFQAFR